MILFEPLHESHFEFILKWLEKPHVKKWWDQDMAYTYDLVASKYRSYVEGYKVEKGERKTIQSFIVHYDNNPIGYIQVYNAYDFSREEPLIGLPSSLGSFDFYIGEEHYLHQGLGAVILLAFFNQHARPFSYLFADPEHDNTAAIRCYEKAGFKKRSNPYSSKRVWMLKDMSLMVAL